MRYGSRRLAEKMCIRDRETVGRLGVGALNLAMYRDEQLAERVRCYRDAVAVATPVGDMVTNHFACNPATLVLRDDSRACRYGLRGAMYLSLIHI